MELAAVFGFSLIMGGAMYTVIVYKAPWIYALAFAGSVIMIQSLEKILVEKPTETIESVELSPSDSTMISK